MITKNMKNSGVRLVHVMLRKRTKMKHYRNRIKICWRNLASILVPGNSTYKYRRMRSKKSNIWRINNCGKSAERRSSNRN